MKKITAILSIAALAVSLTACGGGQSQGASTSQAASSSASQAASSSASQASSSSASGSEQMVGGWALNEEMKGNVPSDVQKAFDKAMESYKEAPLEAIDYLGNQVVAGKNHMLLCRTTDPAGLKVAVVYEDLEGNAEITGTTNFDIGEYSQKEDGAAGEQGLSGGWSVYEDQPVAELPADVQTAWDKAMQGLTGADYTPAILLGSQLVSGNNYAILAKQTLVTANPVTNLAVVYLYVPLTGDAEITNIYPLDLASYNQ